MKYYKDLNNKVYAYESDGSQDDSIPPELILISEVEAQAILESQIVTPEVTSVSKFQAKASLLHFGYYDTVVAIMEDPATDQLTKLAWTETSTFKKDSTTVAGISAILDLTEAEITELFEYASGVDA